MKKDMTFEEFDAMCQRLDDSPYQCDDWFPTLDEITRLIKPHIANSKTMLEFAVWIDTTADISGNPSQQAARKELRMLINSNLKLKESKSTTVKNESATEKKEV